MWAKKGIQNLYSAENLNKSGGTVPINRDGYTRNRYQLVRHIKRQVERVRGRERGENTKRQTS